jgi:syntaxin-binding protein 5
MDAFNFDKPAYEYFTPLRLRPGAQKKIPGYHADLVCFTPWVNGDPPSLIKCLTLNANYGLMAYGNNSGLVIVDIVQNVCLINMGTADIYGSVDPFQRMPKSPRPGFGDGSPSDFIQRVDLSNYSQCNEDKKEKETEKNEKDKLLPTQKDVARVKSPNPGKLNKAGSSGEDTSFSKSLSSSVNSLDQLISCEGVTAVEFVDTFATKNDYTLHACCIVGTSLGSVVMIIISLPDRGDPRLSEPVVVSPSGSLFRIRGPVMTMAYFDCR